MSSQLDKIEAKIDKVLEWIEARTPPPPPKPEGVLYCHMVKKNVGHGRGCSCTTETGCGYYGDKTHGYPYKDRYIPGRSAF